MSLQFSAAELWQHGMTHITVDAMLVATVRQTHRMFLAERAKRRDGEVWKLQREGEAEYDRGFITRLPEGGKDIKTIFHYDTGLCPPVGYESDVVANLFLRAQYELMVEVNQKILRLLQYLQPYLSCDCEWWKLFGRGEHVPYSTTTLRSLLYPDMPGQAGAKEHIDRSFITVHMGDRGGSLEVLGGPGQTSSAAAVSPREGMALVFFGVKALWVTEGKQQPLWHRSVTRPGQDRFALVQFCHVPLPDGYQVTDAGAAYEYYQSQYAHK